MSYKQVDTQNENLKIKIPECDENKSRRIRKKHCHIKFKKEDFIWLYQKIGWADFNKLQITDSTLNEGTNS